MKVLITGASGFVGSHLSEALAHQGYTIKVLVRRSSDVTLLKSLGIEIAYGDITDAAAVKNAVQGCRYVYHLAAKRARHKLSREQYLAINVMGTENVARAALQASVDRLVYGSGTGIYGFIKRAPIFEHTESKPDSFYHESKSLGEKVLLGYHKEEGLPVVVARLGNLIGPGSFDCLDLCRALATKRFRIIGRGANHAHLAYVSDVVDGLQRCCEVGGIDGETYLITGGEATKVTDLVDMIAQELGIHRRFGRLPASPFRAFKSLAEGVYRRFGFELPYAHRYNLFLVNKIFDISKAKTELCYCPKITTREGIHRTIHWYREKGYL